MDPEIENFLRQVKEGHWDIVDNLLSNPGINKRNVLSAIEERYHTVVQDMLNIKIGRQPLKKSRHPFVDDDDDDDGFETGNYLTRLQGMHAAEEKAEEKSKKVTDLIERLRKELDEEERLKIEKRVADIEAEHAAWAAAAGRQLQQQHLVGQKIKDHHGGKSRRKRNNKTAKKTKRGKTVKKRKINKRKSNKRRR